jgi:phage baseplate assembly protein W
MAVGISAKLPLAYPKSDGPYLLTKDLTENTKQNLKTLIFTNPGERVMILDFGVGFSALTI